MLSCEMDAEPGRRRYSVDVPFMSGHVTDPWPLHFDQLLLCKVVFTLLDNFHFVM